MYSAKHIIHEPYRPFFLLGWIEWIFSFSAWTGWRIAIAHGSAAGWRWELLPTHFHTQSLIEGVIAAFALGFLLTAYPKQNEANPISGLPLGALALTFAVARLLFWANAFGLAQTANVSRVLESAVVLVAWLIAGRIWWTHSRNQIQAGAAVIAFTLFAVTLVGGVARPGLAETAVWLALPLLILSLGYRIFPFFASKRLADYQLQRGPYFLQGMLLLSALGLAWLWGGARVGAPQWIGAIPPTLLAFWILGEMVVWRAWRFFKLPLLGILALGIGWMVTAYLLGAWEALPLSRPTGFRLERFHIMGVGALFTLLSGIAVRVSLGHAGKPPVADIYALILFALVQAAVLIRILPGLFPNLVNMGVPWDGWPAGALMALAGLIGITRYGPLVFYRQDAR